jgi:beta-galactosidase
VSGADVVPASDAGEGRSIGKASREPLADEFRCSRRAVLRAGLIGAAALAWSGTANPTAARGAAPASLSAPALGAYALNQDWLFGGQYVPGAEGPAYPETGFVDVTLPHIVTDLSWGDWDPTAWEAIWIYRKHLDGSLADGGRVFVDFQGAMTSAKVYLGGVQISEHRGGYLPWSIELTPNLAPGDNVLAVVVDARWVDVPPDGAPGGASAVDYLQPGGIYRDVALRITPQVCVHDLFAKPIDVLSPDPGVEVEFTIDAAVVPSGPVTVTATLLDDGTQLGSATGTATVAAAGVTVAAATITGIGNVTLWSPDTPKLYQVNGTVVADGVAHTVQVTTGFREATFELDGFYLNGKRLEIFGLNRHQLFPYTGMAGAERLQRRDAELLKNELNCNMVRCSHYPQSPHFLDACDELGLMVWEEPPGWQYVGDAAFQEIVVENVQDMVVRDRNRPSVIVWATRLNETANYTSLYATTRELAYSLDGSRQTTGAMDVQSTSGWTEDVFAYDDYHSANGNAILEPPVSGVPYMVSEAVGALDGAPLYRWVDTGATLAIQARMHAEVHDIAQSKSAYAGLLGWAGIDYASLSGGNRIWHNVKWPGVLDTFRVPKLGAAIYQSQVDPTTKAVILPVFFWDFGPLSPANGPGAGTMIATNCERLEMYVGGAHFATATPDTADYGSLAYPPAVVDLTVSGTRNPELLVEGYVGQALVATLKMASDPSRDQLVLTVEDSAIQGDGTDATRFTFRALDAYGNQRPYPAGDVNLALSGPATLIADSPFPFATYGGVGGGFIRSQPGTSGSVTITATHPALGQASGQLTVQTAAPSTGNATPGTEVPALRALATPPPPPQTMPTPRAIAASVSRIRAALAAVLSPHGRHARIGQLLKHSGYTVKFDAPMAGKLVIDWYHIPKAKLHAKHKKPREVLVAGASVSIKRPGPVEVKIKLTPRGRSLLEHAKRERLTVKASFTPLGLRATTLSKIIELRR